MCVWDMSAGHEYVGDTRGLCNMFNAADVLGISVGRGMKGVGGVCDMGMCLARGDVGGEWITGLGLGFSNPVGSGGSVLVIIKYRDMIYSFNVKELLDEETV